MLCFSAKHRAVNRRASLVAMAVSSALAVVTPGCGKKADSPAASGTPAPNAAPPASPGPAAAPAEVVITKDTPEAIANLAKLVAGTAAEPASRARSIVDGLRARTGVLLSTQPIGREILAPVDAAKAILTASEAARPALTGIEAGALLRALFEALAVPAEPVLVYERQAGKTNLRRRDIGLVVDFQGLKGTLVPRRQAEPLEADGAEALTAAGESGLFLGLASLRLAEERKVDVALARLTEAETARPDDGALAFLRGQLTAIRGDSDAGLDAMEAAVKKYEDADGNYQLAIAYLQAEERFSGYKALSKAVSLDPAHIRAWSALGSVVLDRRQGAEEAERPAIDGELDRIEAGLLAVGPETEGLAELKIQRLRVGGKVAEAEKLALEVLNKDPKRAALYLVLADIAVGKGEAEAAERYLVKAADADPQDSQALVRLAQMRADHGDVDKTIEAFKKATDRAPYDSDLLSSYAGLLIQAGKVEEATAVAKDLVARFPEVADGYAIQAQVAFQSGDLPSATGQLEKALGKDPKALDLYTMLYVAYVMQQQPDKAVTVLDRLLKVDPDGRMRIAQTLLQTGQVEGATGLLEKEHEASPDRLEVTITLGQIYQLSGRKDDVAKMRAAVAAKGDPKALETFDGALAEMAKQAEAAEGTAPSAPEAPPVAPEAPPVAPEAPPAPAPPAAGAPMVAPGGVE